MGKGDKEGSEWEREIKNGGNGGERLRKVGEGKGY